MGGGVRTGAPFFSVIMPVFNAERYLGEAIASVTRQSFSDFELIVIDDGSTDASAGVMRDHGSRDPRIITRSRGRQGIVATRNEGVQLARGRFVAFLDADDIAEPRRLEIHQKYLERHPDCLAVGGQILFIDDEGYPLYRSDLPLDHGAIDSQHMSGRGCGLSQGASAINRESILGIGGYRDGFPVAEDLDLFLRLAEVGRLGNVGDVVIRCRLHPESLTHTHLADGPRWAAAAIREARVRRGLGPEEVDIPPGRDRSGPAEAMFRAMKAHQHGFQRTALRYACRSLVEAPTDPVAWRVALVVLLSRPRQRFCAFVGSARQRPADTSVEPSPPVSDDRDV
jgi:glycosyltransferase involved in cell wall biosynthesis